MTLDERIAQEVAEWKELSGRHKRTMIWKKTADLDDDTRNLIIAGGYISQFFPQLADFRPQATEDENDVEYAQLICFLTLLVSDVEYISKLMKTVSSAFEQEEVHKGATTHR